MHSSLPSVSIPRLSLGKIGFEIILQLVWEGMCSSLFDDTMGGFLHRILHSSMVFLIIVNGRHNIYHSTSIILGLMKDALLIICLIITCYATFLHDIKIITANSLNGIYVLRMGRIQNHVQHRLIKKTECGPAISFCVSDLFSITSK